MDALRMLSCEMADWAGRFNKKIWYMKINLFGYTNAVLKVTRYLPISAIVRCTSCLSRRIKRHMLKWKRATVEKNSEGIQKMRVTYCNMRASVFLVHELKPFEGWSQGSFRVQLSLGTCNCGLFQPFHFPCDDALATCAATSVEWGLYVYEVELPLITNEKLWSEWHRPRLRPNPAMCRKAIDRLVLQGFVTIWTRWSTKINGAGYAGKWAILGVVVRINPQRILSNCITYATFHMY
ncbi:hypothetical protein Ahy_A09g044262 [Arachis hypogaea]|uniref:SWIM-type domain-containing protein n=1 Tax=Arachis hypogaea TaxID=3818 RepID=A0A445BJS0_ARAHY|nr:hypothetical protein Ahy_A09g044262 [Arachis hypogaea]